MLKHSFTDSSHAENAHSDAGAEALLAGLPLLAKAEESEDEPTSYASPPCYLAEFSDAGLADHPAK